MKKNIFIFLIAFLSLIVTFNSTYAKVQKIKVTSPSIANKKIIPDEHACEFLGSDKSPELSFSNGPSHTQSFALILDDPDAPGETFNHWVIFNIPVSESKLEEGLAKDPTLENGIKQGKNGTEGLGYFGPCPPPKETHRYIFKVYALDTILDLEAGATKRQLIKAMKGHIVGRGKLIGLYKNNTEN